MMEHAFLTDPQGGLVQPWQGSAAALVDAVSGLAHVWWLRGSRMRTRQGLFDEWAAAAQFPPHFGSNWDALRDALADLPEGGIFLVLEANQLLQEAPPQDWAALWSVLKAAQEDLHPKAIRLVLQSEPEAYQTLVDGLRAMGLV